MGDKHNKQQEENKRNIMAKVENNLDCDIIGMAGGASSSGKQSMLNKLCKSAISTKLKPMKAIQAMRNLKHSLSINNVFNDEKKK